METSEGKAGTVSNEQLSGELRALMLTAEEVLEHTAGQVGEAATEAHARLASALERIKGRVSAAESSVLRAARQKVATADLYVHNHPWQSVGVSAVVAAGVGFLLGMLIGRR